MFLWKMTKKKHEKIRVTHHNILIPAGSKRNPRGQRLVSRILFGTQDLQAGGFTISSVTSGDGCGFVVEIS